MHDVPLPLPHPSFEREKDAQMLLEDLALGGRGESCEYRLIFHLGPQRKGGSVPCVYRLGHPPSLSRIPNGSLSSIVPWADSTGFDWYGQGKTRGNGSPFLFLSLPTRYSTYYHFARFFWGADSGHFPTGNVSLPSSATTMYCISPIRDGSSCFVAHQYLPPTLTESHQYRRRLLLLEIRSMSLKHEQSGLTGKTECMLSKTGLAHITGQGQISVSKFSGRGSLVIGSTLGGMMSRGVGDTIGARFKYRVESGSQTSG
ncbi:hypothetical protein LZ30DRAFT_141248 [Colletotrichum cereale]|nr:hypothetical protein LZ30DRAFT_141248 [Colletotrichum cereale]